MAGLAKLQWYVRRLQAMGLGEVVHRVGEKLRQKTEVRALKRLAVQGFDSAPEEGVPTIPHRDCFEADFLAALGSERDDIIAGRWRILRGHLVKVDSPPIWHRDYVNGGEYETNKRSHDLDHRQMPPRMDVRFVWETSRWIQIARLAQAAEQEIAIVEER